MLEFINVTATEKGKDVHTRRLVRAQAMRDYRRRQRDAKTTGKEECPRFTPSLNMLDEAENLATYYL